MDTQPSYRSHHIDTGLGLGEMADGGPLGQDRAYSVLELGCHNHKI